jgi:nitroimidazol reductase NimA-like FMN-containing flavoprotein (pyridoxamine 5'-phosphate oxidase superfamily)
MMAAMSEPVTWSEVAGLLAPARNFWLGTVDPAGAPHAVPVWAVAVDEAIYFYGERRSKKFRNIAANPWVVLHLESGDEVVIVRGTATDLGAPAVAPDVVAAFTTKYTLAVDRQWLPQVDPTVDVLARLEPSVALLWSGDFETTQRRWSARS